MNSESAVAAGAMLYAGMLPNGRTFYGSRTLMADEGSAQLPFYHYSDIKSLGYVFSGGLAVLPNAETQYRTVRWSVGEAWLPVWETADGYAHRSAFAVYGGYYDPYELTDRFREDFNGGLMNFALQADTGAIVSGRHGKGAGMSPVSAEMTSTNMPQLVAGTANPQSARLYFSQLTGVVYGNFDIPFAGEDVSVTFRGIALPGWQGCDECSTGFVLRPWALGSCSFSDRAKSVGTYRNGCSVKLDRVD